LEKPFVRDGVLAKGGMGENVGKGEGMSLPDVLAVFDMKPKIKVLNRANNREADGNKESNLD
jgi:hypothetical protein